MRKVATQSEGPVTVKVFRNAEWDEYVCRLYVQGRLVKGADYHTPDRDDAYGSAQAMLEGAKS